MASNEKSAPVDQSPQAVAVENTAADAPVIEKGPDIDEKNPAMLEEAVTKTGYLPSPEERIEALGIPNWRELEKKLVRRLDMTLMPCTYPTLLICTTRQAADISKGLWVLYFFNYMDRASIGQARLSEPSIDDSLNLTGSNFSSAVSILSLG